MMKTKYWIFFGATMITLSLLVVSACGSSAEAEEDSVAVNGAANELYGGGNPNVPAYVCPTNNYCNWETYTYYVHISDSYGGRSVPVTTTGWVCGCQTPPACGWTTRGLNAASDCQSYCNGRRFWFVGYQRSCTGGLYGGQCSDIPSSCCCEE